MRKFWTDKLDNLLRRHYPNGDLDALAARLGVTKHAVKSRALKLGIRREVHAKQPWTDRQIAFLCKHYATMTAKDIAKKLKRSEKSVYCHAKVLGLEKDSDFIAELGRQLSRHPKAVANRFQKGCAPFNKGKRQEEFMSPEAIERARATRFKKGNVPHNIKPDGYERTGADGYVFIKVGGKMVHKHRHVWEQHHGEIPEGMLVTFCDGNRRNCDIDNLELRSMADNARRTVMSETPEARHARCAKGMRTRNEAIRRDRLRIKYGLKPKTRLVKNM